MAVLPERVLAIDIDAQTVRGLVLANEIPAVAGGYAQLDYEPAQGPVAFAARIAMALDVKATLPVAIVCDPDLGAAARADIVAAITEAGFSDVRAISRSEAQERANPGGGVPQELADVEIPSGLLTSHAGLTLADLAPVVGAGLGLLRGQASEELGQNLEEASEPLAAWTPTAPAPAAGDIDPFTGTPTTSAPAAALTPAAAAAIAAVAAAAGDDDDDLTVAAPANRLTAPTPSPSATDDQDNDAEDSDDITGPAPVVVADAANVDVELPNADDPSVSFLDAGDDVTQAASSSDLDELARLTESAGDADADDASATDYGDDATINPSDDQISADEPDDDATINPSDDQISADEPDDDATINPTDDQISADDATINPDDMPAVATAAAAAVVEDNIDATVVMDRSTLREAAVADAAVSEAAEAELSAAAVAPAAANAADRPPTITAGTADQNTSGQRRWLVIGLLALALVVLLGFVLSQCGGSDETSTSTTGVPSPAATEQPAVASADVTDASAEPSAEPTAVPPTPAPTPEPTAVPAPAAQPDPTPAPEPTPEPTVDPLAGLPPLSSLPERGAIFRPPTLFLEGPVQTQEQADELYERAIAVVGPDNVQNNYVVRPDAPPALDGNVRVEQAVLFQSGSAVISEQFIPTLELGVAVMALNPQVQMVVEGHTDSVGSVGSNVLLSQRRAEAVVDYLVSRGVDADRLEALGLGEGNPVESNDTAEGRQINRRIEVNLLDLLATE